jgi:hypothetical protein
VGFCELSQVITVVLLLGRTVFVKNNGDDLT